MHFTDAVRPARMPILRIGRHIIIAIRHTASFWKETLTYTIDGGWDYSWVIGVWSSSDTKVAKVDKNGGGMQDQCRPG